MCPATPPRRLRRCWGPFIVALLASPAVHAQQMRVSIDDCVPVDEASVRRIFAAEEKTSLDSASETRRRATTVRVDCEDDRVVVAVDLVEDDSRIERSIDLEVVPERARARVLAMCMSELVAAAWGVAEAWPSAVPGREPAVPEPAPVEPTGSPWDQRWQLAAQMGGEVTVAAGRGSLLMAASLARALDGRLRASADLEWATGQATVSLGSVSAERLSSAFVLSARAKHGMWEWDGGLGARGGGALLRGMARDDRAVGYTSLRAFGGPCAAAHLGLDLGGRWFARLSLESGWFALPLVTLSDRRDEARWSGAWIRTAVGAGRAF